MSNTLRDISGAGAFSQVPQKEWDQVEACRVAEQKYEDLEHNYQQLKMGKEIRFLEMRCALQETAEREGNRVTKTKCEDDVMLSEQWQKYLRLLVNARKAARNARIEATALERLYWKQNSIEATNRKQMGMR